MEDKLCFTQNCIRRNLFGLSDIYNKSNWFEFTDVHKIIISYQTLIMNIDREKNIEIKILEHGNDCRSFPLYFNENTVRLRLLGYGFSSFILLCFLLSSFVSFQYCINLSIEKTHKRISGLTLMASTNNRTTTHARSHARMNALAMKYKV